MFKDMLKEIRIGLISTLVLAVVLCGIYPVLVWGLAQGVFPRQANGSLIYSGRQPLGSSLLAQAFNGQAYFHSRPSAAGAGYDAMCSGGSNLGPLSRKLSLTITRRIRDYRRENNLPDTVPVPADAVTASASGLDPHISVANALLQLPRIAKVRGLRDDDVRRVLERHTQGPDVGVLGERRVNVMELNLELDEKG